MPAVECPACRRECRVRQESLGRKVVCTHCQKPFIAETPLPDMPGSGTPISYVPGNPGPWQGTIALVLLVGAAVLALWLLSQS